MYYISKQLSDFSAAHRILKGYQGKCQNLHGHDYGVEVVLGALTLDQYDLVVDFSDIKNLFNNWVQNNLDHVTIVSQDDSKLQQFLITNSQKFYTLPGGVNTSVESIAKHLFEIFENLLVEHKNISLIEVSVSETKTAKARYFPLPLAREGAVRVW